MRRTAHPLVGCMSAAKQHEMHRATPPSYCDTPLLVRCISDRCRGPHALSRPTLTINSLRLHRWPCRDHRSLPGSAPPEIDPTRYCTTIDKWVFESIRSPCALHCERKGVRHRSTTHVADASEIDAACGHDRVTTQEERDMNFTAIFRVDCGRMVLGPD